MRHLNAMVNERKHKDAKDLARMIPTNVDFELSLLRRMLLHQVEGLRTCNDGVDWVTCAVALDKPTKDVTAQLKPHLEMHVEVEGRVLASKRAASYSAKNLYSYIGLRIVISIP